LILLCFCNSFGFSQTHILLKKTYIENEIVSNYNISDNFTITIDRVPYTLHVSELLPNRKTSIMQHFKTLFPFVSVDLKELDHSQILREIIEDTKDKDISPAQFVFVCLLNKAKNNTTYYSLTPDKVKCINNHILECLQYCFKHNVHLNLSQFRNVNGVDFGIQHKYFNHSQDVLLPSEVLSMEIQQWANTDERKQFLYDLGVRKSDHSVIKCRIAWLEGKELNENVTTSEETLEWISTKSSQYLHEDAEKRHERITLLKKLLGNNCERKNNTLCDQIAVELEDKKYLDWKAKKGVTIKVCPKGIPVELYHKDFTYCTIYEDSYLVHDKTIYISGISEAKDILKKVSASTSIFTIEDWYYIFSVSSDAYNDLQKEKDILNNG
jgi:hypothetical protein